MKVLITGITGHLGSEIAKTLVALGDEVIALLRSSSSLSRIESILPNIICCDVDNLNLSILFKKYKTIDAVIHTATNYGRNGESISAITETNLLFPLRLMEEASNAGVRKFLNTGTTHSENVNPYSFSKFQFNQWGQYFASRRKIQFINLRLGTVYGPEDDESKFATYIIKNCVNNVPELRLTMGEQMRDFIYIDDVVSAFPVLLSRIDSSHDPFLEFDVGSGSSISIREFSEFVHRVTGAQSRLMFGAIPYRENEQMTSNLDNGPLSNLGWAYKTSLADGISAVIERFRQ